MYALKGTLELFGLLGNRTNNVNLIFKAIGFSLFTNPFLTSESQCDVGLIEAWNNFKLFWVKYCLMGSSIIDTTNSKGELIKECSLPNLPRAIQGLKTLSAWVGWYAANYPINAKPKTLPDFPCYLPKENRNTLS